MTPRAHLSSINRADLATMHDLARLEQRLDARIEAVKREIIVLLHAAEAADALAAQRRMLMFTILGALAGAAVLLFAVV